MAKQQDKATEFDPGASATHLKTVLVGGIAALGYLVWRSEKTRGGEGEAGAGPSTPFDEWEPSE